MYRNGHIKYLGCLMAERAVRVDATALQEESTHSHTGGVVLVHAIYEDRRRVKRENKKIK